MDRSNASDHIVHNKSLNSTSQNKTWHLVIRNEASLQQANVVSCLPAARSMFGIRTVLLTRQMRFNPGSEPAVLSSGTAAKFTLPSVTNAAWENEKYASAWSARTNGSKRIAGSIKAHPLNKVAETRTQRVSRCWSDWHEVTRHT